MEAGPRPDPFPCRPGVRYSAGRAGKAPGRPQVQEVWVNRNEMRYRLDSTFRQAHAPLALGELAFRSRIGGKKRRSALKGVVAEGLVVEGDLVADRPGPHYRWAARLEKLKVVYG